MTRYALKHLLVLLPLDLLLSYMGRAIERKWYAWNKKEDYSSKINLRKQCAISVKQGKKQQIIFGLPLILISLKYPYVTHKTDYKKLGSIQHSTSCKNLSIPFMKLIMFNFNFPISNSNQL